MTTIETIRTAHGSEPLTLAELKTALGVTGSDHDSYLTYLLTAAREYAEVEANVGLVPQTIEAWLPEMSAWYQLPFAPIVSITSVKTYSGGTLQATLTYGDDYYIVGDRIYFTVTALYQVQVIYEAGYYTAQVGTTTTTTSADAADYTAALQPCPKMARVAVERLVRDWYDNPEQVGTLGRDARMIIRKFGRRDWL